MDLLALLFPKEKKFYQMVEKQVTMVGSAVDDFDRLITDYKKLSPSARNKLIRNISLKEKEDDYLYIEMVRALKSTFITPIDREDLHQLVTTLDVIVDNLEMISFKIKAFKIDKIDKKLMEQTKVLVQAFRIIEKLIFAIKNEAQVEKYCLKVGELEQDGDKVYAQALEELFSGSLPVLTVIKFKDLYSSLEKIIDKIRETSLIIENIAVKYS